MARATATQTEKLAIGVFAHTKAWQAPCRCSGFLIHGAALPARQISRFTALVFMSLVLMTMAIGVQVQAGMDIGDEGNPIPWSQYNGRGGVNYTYVSANKYGYESQNSKGRIVNCPDGHPDQAGSGFPTHHNCPHFHAVKELVMSRYFPI